MAKIDPTIAILAERLQAAFKRAWESRYSRSQYFATKKDQKQFLDWAKMGVSENSLTAKAKVFMAIERPYFLQVRHPVRLLEENWNELDADETTTKEECLHPMESMRDVVDYGPQIKGTCGLCGWKGYKHKENQ